MKGFKTNTRSGNISSLRCRVTKTWSWCRARPVTLSPSCSDANTSTAMSLGINLSVSHLLSSITSRRYELRSPTKSTSLQYAHCFADDGETLCQSRRTLDPARNHYCIRASVENSAILNRPKRHARSLLGSHHVMAMRWPGSHTWTTLATCHRGFAAWPGWAVSVCSPPISIDH